MTAEMSTINRVSELGEDRTTWHRWAQGGQTSLIRRLDDLRYVAVIPFLFTWGVVWGYLEEHGHFYEDRWCYHDLPTAIAAATDWRGVGEPVGWHRHPLSGRRRPDGSPDKEYINP